MIPHRRGRRTTLTARTGKVGGSGERLLPLSTSFDQLDHLADEAPGYRDRSAARSGEMSELGPGS